MLKDFPVSHSMSMTARSCWKKFYWQYIERLQPKVRPLAYFLGATVHDAFNMYYNRFSSQEVTQYIEQQFDEKISSCGPHETEDYVIAKYTALAMWENYPMSYADFEDIKPEMEFSVPLVGDSLRYVGRMDGLVKYNHHWWVREMKTSTLSFNQFTRRSDSSPQATGYVWAARKLGYDVKGVIYDYIRKPLLRKWTNDTMDTFGKRIAEDYKKRPDFYFARHLSYRSDYIINEYEKDMLAFADDMVGKMEKKDSLAFYRNTASCFVWNSECPFFKICLQESIDPLTLELFYEKKGEKDAGESSGGAEDE